MNLFSVRYDTHSFGLLYATWNTGSSPVVGTFHQALPGTRTFKAKQALIKTFVRTVDQKYKKR